jgi:PAS domain S-box-containing protein
MAVSKRSMFFFVWVFVLVFLQSASTREPLSPNNVLLLSSLTHGTSFMWLEPYKLGGELTLLLLLALALLGGYLLFEHSLRKNAEHSVARQRHFEAFVSHISSELINVSPTQTGSEIQKSLMDLRRILGVDRISIYKLTERESTLRRHHTARVEGAPEAPEFFSRREFSWLFERFAETEPLVISRREDLPHEAVAERNLFREIELHAVVIFPLRVENRLEGILTFGVIQAGGRAWPEDVLAQLKVVSQVYASAFARELTQEALAESESRFRVLDEATPAFIWMMDPVGRFTYLTEKASNFTGARPGELNGNGWLDYVHPTDRPAAVDVIMHALERHERFVSEYRIRRNDGTYRWMFDVGNPRFNTEGTFIGFIGLAVDTTDQQLAREALGNVSGQLIAAQEKERSRLARELHDDICQRLAMLSLRIEKIAKGWSNGQMPVGTQLEQIWRQCSDLTGDVQALSHELHPSILDNLGLVTAVRSFCREFSRDSGTTVHFTERDVPNSLPRQIALSLFRIIQEGLHNAAKYSGKKHFEVRLHGKPGEIELEVSDQGIGFDVASMKRAEGLGLVSMSERIHLLNGRINIESKPRMGTKIHARVPLRTEPTTMPTAMR